MSRFLGALLGAVLLHIGAVSAETVTRATAPPLLLVPPTIPAFPDMPVQSLAPMAPVNMADDPDPIKDALARQSDISAFGFACDQTMTLTPRPGGMLDLVISAPCKPGAMVEVRHAGLVFDVTLSNTGKQQVTVPALEFQARIDTVFADGGQLSAKAVVPELVDYARIAVGWDTAAATFRGTAPRGLQVEELTLGDANGRNVQILSYHIDPERRSGVIRLTVQKAVTAQNCASAQRADVVRHLPGQPVTRYGLRLAGPGCDRVGDNLVLNNILPDLKLAAN